MSSHTPSGQGPGAPLGRGSESQSIKGMLSEAMAKSRGQGVVQGSTIFFKNLADSVAHSNRNLKIGLAFLTASFLVVAGILGYLVFTAFRGQLETRATLESRYQELDAKTQKILEPFLVRSRELEERLARTESQVKVDLETYRLNADQRVDAARAEVQQLRQEVAALQRDVAAVQKWIQDANRDIKTAFDNVEGRLQALERGKR